MGVILLDQRPEILCQTVGGRGGCLISGHEGIRFLPGWKK